MTITHLITGGTAPDGNGTDVAIAADGTIAELGQDLVTAGAQVVDASGKIVMPGLVDLHTHLREPGKDRKSVV